MPILIYLPVWLERTGFGTSNGSNGGYMCYPEENGKLVVMTNLERDYFLVTDSLVLFFIVISGCIVVWSFRKEAIEAEKQVAQEHRRQVKSLINQIKKKLMHSAGAIVLSYVVLRLPWMIVTEISVTDTYSDGRKALSLASSNSLAVKIAILLYFLKFNVLFLYFALTNKNYRHAYGDFMKLICPCCCCKQESIQV